MIGSVRGMVSGLILTAALVTGTGHAQGCSQCADQMRSTPARVQSAYRRAIVLMVLAGGGVFSGAVLTLRRFR